MKKILLLIVAAAICGLALFVFLFYVTNLTRTEALNVSLAGALAGLAVELAAVYIAAISRRRGRG